MNPLFQFMYPSMANFDVSRGTPESMMNTFGNFMLADWQARPLLYMTPLLNFSNVFQYPQLGGNFQLPNSNGFGSIFDFNPPKMDNTTFGQFNFGLPFGLDFGNKPKTKTDDKPETAEDRKLQAKIDKLSCLLEQISEDKDFLGSKKSKEIKGKIEDAKSLETRKEQYNELKKAYESIDTDVMRSFLVQARLTDDLNDSDTEEVKNLLQSAGYEDGNERRTRHSDIKDSLNKISSWVDSINDENGNATECPIITQLTTKNYEILDLVSEWNTQKKTNIISVMIRKYDQLNDAGRKEQFYNSSIGVLVEALVKEASDTIALKIDGKNALDNNEIDKIVKLKEKLNKKSLSTLADDFNNLYALLRIAQTKVAQAKVRDYFDFLDTTDDTVFDDNLFMKDTLDDLKNEKIKVPNNSNEKEKPVNGESNPSDSKAEERTSTSSSIKLNDTEKAEAQKLANDLVDSLMGPTDWENAENFLDKVTQSNALEVLHQYNKKASNKLGYQHIWEKPHGFFRQLITEHGTNGRNKVYAEKIIDKLVEHLNEVKETLDSEKADILQAKIDKINDIKNKGLTRGTCCSLDKYIEQTYALLN